MNLPINLPMNLKDLALWDSGDLKCFALPLKHVSDLSFYFDLKPGTEANIQEPFRRLVFWKSPTQKIVSGVIYRCDDKTVWDSEKPIPAVYQISDRWSQARQLPAFAVRRKAVITKVENTTLLDCTEEQIQLLKLDYESQGDPQMILDEYAPNKNSELLYKWWKAHYPSTLRNETNPNIIILHLDHISRQVKHLI